MTAGGNSAATADGGGRVILHVDDDSANRRLIQRMLQRRPDVRVVAAADAASGFDLARSEHPAVILLDRHLPDASGDDVLRALRGDPETAHLPVVFLSGDAMPEQIQELLDAGADGYLTKPFDIAELLATVDRLLEQGRGGQR